MPWPRLDSTIVDSISGMAPAPDDHSTARPAAHPIEPPDAGQRGPALRRPRAGRFRPTATDPVIHPVVAFTATEPGLVARLLSQQQSDCPGRCLIFDDQVRGARPARPSPVRVYAAQAWKRVSAAHKALYALRTAQPNREARCRPPSGRAG
jgi:hypothetical protein